MISSFVVMMVKAENVEYGDQVYFQNMHMDRRWMSGSRGSGNEGVHTRDALGSSYELTTVPNAYKWVVRSHMGSGRKNHTDPKKGQCLKFGDKIFLQNYNMDHRWLSGSRSKGNEDVITRDMNKNDYERKDAGKSYQWTVRSSLGSGIRGRSDQAEGHCVSDKDVLYLQNEFMDYRWLSGARSSGNESVVVRNSLKSDYEKNDARKTYQWIVRLNGLGHGGRQDAISCVPLAAEGSWRQVTYSNAASKSIKYSVTVSESSQMSRESTLSKTYENTVSQEISAGFEFKGIGIGSTTSVSSTYSSTASHTIGESFSRSRTEQTDITTTFNQPGQIWQFVYDVETTCGGDIGIKVNDLVITEGQPPCCLPGYAKDIHKQHGPCRNNSPCSCEASICSSS